MWKEGMEYEGEFKAGKRHGIGEWKENEYEESDSYQGNYFEDKKHGQGTYKWSTGNWYRGSFTNDQRNGYGEMHWSDGSVYKGEWRDGIQHGYGTMIYNNGVVKTGNFINNMFIDSNVPITIPLLDSNKQQQRDSEPIPSRIIENPNEKSIPLNNKIRIERKDGFDGLANSNHENSSGDNNVEYEYNNYDNSFNNQNYLLQKKYNEILAKRFPNSKSEETTAHQTPIRSLPKNSGK